jgi:hypothetical protein
VCVWRGRNARDGRDMEEQLLELFEGVSRGAGKVVMS